MPLTDRVARCVEIKAEVVAGDERERRRAGRCSTTATRWPTRSRSPPTTQLTHGEAVGIGLVFAAELAAPLGRIDAGAGRRAPRGRRWRLRPADVELPAGLDAGRAAGADGAATRRRSTG